MTLQPEISGHVVATLAIVTHLDVVSMEMTTVPG